jgi:hypothetical protein
MNIKRDNSTPAASGDGVVRFPRLIRRFPRLTAEDVAFHRTRRLIAKLEARARIWIGRGREANIQLGRIFIRLKHLVGHGHFMDYYEKTFGQPFGIAFRTAQDYMRLAREADEPKYAAPAHFPLAMDPQAVAIRDRTARHQQAVGEAGERSSRESKSSEERQSTNVERPTSSICTCRLYVRMTRAQRDAIAALWASKHRHFAEVEVTDYLIKLCTEYATRGSSESND